MEFVIYKATNKSNSKSYIGYTCNYKKRIKEHYNESNNTNSSCYYTYFHRAIRKYGWNMFTWEIIFTSSLKNFTHKVMEPFYIEYFNTYGEKGYNTTKGGEVGPYGFKYEEEQNKAKSERSKGIKNPAYDNVIYKFRHEQYGIFEGTQYEFKQKYNFKCIYDILHGRQKSMHGWKLVDDQGNIKYVNLTIGENHYKYNDKIFEFQHTTGEIFTGTLWKFRRLIKERYNGSCHITEVINGNRKHCHGWSVKVV